MKRLIVYFHYDPLGQIDTACRVAVEAMAHYGEVFFISNGTLRPADRAWAASVTLTCRERENKGLDVGAYKEALTVIGRGRWQAPSARWPRCSLPWRPARSWPFGA